ncbi:MAG: hypothetical protein MZW92_48670 [Comamonadaceae bacterium]|nr:hypothetical protein [Comamonadaceae bacterium]
MISLGHRRDGVRRVADVPGLLRRRGAASAATAPPAAPFLGIAGLTFGPRPAGLLPDRRAGAFVCMVAMFALTHTPLGRIANAVRDNPERAEFIGYDTQRVRWLMLMLSGFFAGVAGGLSAINFEIVARQRRARDPLPAACCWPPSSAASAVLLRPDPRRASCSCSSPSRCRSTRQAWQLYLGVFFVLLVMFAPGGLSSLILLNLRVAKFGKFRRLRDPYVGVLGARRCARCRRSCC